MMWREAGTLGECKIKNDKETRGEVEARTKEDLLCEAEKRRRKDIKGKRAERRGLLKIIFTLGYNSIWIALSDINNNCVHTSGE